MANSDDKRELLKLKQGLVSADDSPLEVDEKPEAVKLKGKAALKNFIYHHSLHLKIGGFFAVIAAVFAFFILTAEKNDIVILFIADTSETSVFFTMNYGELKGAIEAVTPDFDGNGKVRADCRFIDLVTSVGEVERDPEAVHGNNVKLFGEVSAGDSMLYIGNREALASIPGEAMSAEDFYSEFYSISETNLALDFPEDLYVAVRNSKDKSKKAFIEALQLSNNMTN